MEDNYAFIDSQNLNLSVQELGWRLDFAKFRTYLQDKFRVTKAYLFIGFIPGNQKLYDYLQKVGYTLIFKPTVKAKGGAKGNVDAELVLHTMIQYDNYDKAVIVTGDGDFYCLVEHLLANRKFKALVVPNKHKYSSLFRGFREYITFLNWERRKLGAGKK